jgi:hypothetical protein
MVVGMGRMGVEGLSVEDLIVGGELNWSWVRRAFVPKLRLHRREHDAVD